MTTRTPDGITAADTSTPAPTTDDAAAVDAAGVDTAAAAEAVIAGLRSEIDRLDTEIAELVAQRAEVSTRVQAARISAGGTRIELGRERVIFEHYRSTLGHDGPALAEAVLRICRGQR